MPGHTSTHLILQACSHVAIERAKGIEILVTLLQTVGVSEGEAFQHPEDEAEEELMQKVRAYVLPGAKPPLFLRIKQACKTHLY